MNTTFNKDTIFRTGNFEPISFSDIIPRIEEYLSDADNGYFIDVGTDSQNGFNTRFVNVISVRKVGKGGIFFYYATKQDKIRSVRDRMYQEATMSIELATQLIELCFEKELLFDVTIHCDVGGSKKTKDLIQEISGYCAAYGFECVTKPEAWVASHLADKFTKSA